MRQLLAGAIDHSADFSTSRPAHGWRPPAVSADILAEIRGRWLPEFERYLRPAEPQRVAARIAVLLAHYYVGDVPAPVFQAMAQDWVDELSQYPAWAVDEAARSWLRRERRRPTIADFTATLEEEVSRERTQLIVLRRLIEANTAEAVG